MLAEDPAEFFTMIFGGDAFVDLYARIPDTIPISYWAYAETNAMSGSAKSR